mmetsp:Transcript_96653/g.268713  ORF Transcript_96653/g.268713 Transcript_96653/m.268713 type:complete len:215 (-) Transcript_96653:512-1156(-)
MTCIGITQQNAFSHALICALQVIVSSLNPFNPFEPPCRAIVQKQRALCHCKPFSLALTTALYVMESGTTTATLIVWSKPTAASHCCPFSNTLTSELKVTTSGCKLNNDIEPLRRRAHCNCLPFSQALMAALRAVRSGQRRAAPMACSCSTARAQNWSPPWAMPIALKSAWSGRSPCALITGNIPNTHAHAMAWLSCVRSMAARGPAVHDEAAAP